MRAPREVLAVGQLQLCGIACGLIVLMALVAPFTKLRETGTEAEGARDRPPYLLYALMGLNVVVVAAGVVVAGVLTFS
jgi:hypothetical protein